MPPKTGNSRAPFFPTFPLIFSLELLMHGIRHFVELLQCVTMVVSRRWPGR